ncbi:MAG: YgjV family protein [Clostridia bacterium]|nr:YgjV family protein [Clostridia bacterium]
MWTIDYILSQICVVVAVVALIITFFTSNKRVILILSLVDVLAYIFQFLLLNQYTGAFLNVVGLIRVLTLYIEHSKGIYTSILTICFLNFLSILVGVVTFVGYYCIFAIIAEFLDTYALWSYSILGYRWCAFFASLFWIIYFIFCKSVFAIGLEIILMVMALFGIVRYYYR